MKKIIQLLCILLITIKLDAQEDILALEINGEKIYLSEMQRAYDKDSKTNKSSFVDNFVNRKLIVQEAINQQLDTSIHYKTEFSSMRVQVANKYLSTTKPYYDIVAKQTYESLLENVDLFHFFYPFPEKDILPDDTLKLYKKVSAKRDSINTIIKDKTYTDFSLDGAVMLDRSTTSGYIGWVRPFTLLAPVEKAMYNIAHGELSMPIRSRQGYHLIKVLGKRPARESVSLEQVTFNFFTIPPYQHEIDSVKIIADKVYETLSENPETFSELCAQYRRANNLTGDQCQYGSFMLNDRNIPASILSTAFSLENIGDVSKPILTHYGYHILRLNDITSVPTYDIAAQNLFTSIKYSDRQAYVDDLHLKDQSEKFKLEENKNLLNKILKLTNKFDPLSNSFIKTLKKDSDTTLFSIANMRTKLAEFIHILYINSSEKPADANILTLEETRDYELSTDRFEDLYKGFKLAKLADYADKNLELRFPEFSYIMQDYRDGVLSYEVKNKEVWSKLKNSSAQEELQAEEQWIKSLKNKAQIKINQSAINQLK